MSDPVAAALPPIPPNIAALTGPPLLGIMLNWSLFGALTVQLYIYAQYFIDDKWWMKCLVYGLYILETAQTALATHDAFEWFAYGFGNMITLSMPSTSSIDAPIMDGVLALVVQLFFCWRIYVLSKSWFFSGAISLVAVAQFIGGLVAGIRSIEINNVTKMRSSTVYLVLWFGGSALADTLIAVAMTFLLLRHEKQTKTGFRGGDVLRKIVRLTIETNSLTAAVAIVGFVSFVALPTTSIFMVPSYALGKLYTNTLLVVFNNRIFLTNKAPMAGSTRSGTSQPDQMASRGAQIVDIKPQPSANQDRFKIKISQDTYVSSDKDYRRPNGDESFVSV